MRVPSHRFLAVQRAERQIFNVKEEMKVDRLTFVAIIACCVLTNLSTARSQPTKITISYSADTPANLPAFVGKDAGIFSKNRLDVQLVRICR